MTRELTQEQLTSFRSVLREAATELFLKHGPEGVTMRALADKVGVSRSTPYRYFRNKDEIIAAVQAEAFQRFADVAEAEYESTDEPVARIAAISESFPSLKAVTKRCTAARACRVTSVVSSATEATALEDANAKLPVALWTRLVWETSWAWTKSGAARRKTTKASLDSMPRTLGLERRITVYLIVQRGN